jgi:hypothetical protein
MGRCPKQHSVLASLPSQDGDPQHNIFTQDQTPEPPYAMKAFHIYQACWMAAYLFTGHVTFPIPRCRRIREDFVFSLRTAILRSTQFSEDANFLGIFIWCTMIGGVMSADIDPVLCQWYLCKFHDCCLALEVHTWETARALLLTFAWVEAACDEAGHRFWLNSQSRVTAGRERMDIYGSRSHTMGDNRVEVDEQDYPCSRQACANRPPTVKAQRQFSSIIPAFDEAIPPTDHPIMSAV